MVNITEKDAFSDKIEKVKLPDLKAFLKEKGRKN